VMGQSLKLLSMARVARVGSDEVGPQPPGGKTVGSEDDTRSFASPLPQAPSTLTTSFNLSWRERDDWRSREDSYRSSGGGGQTGKGREASQSVNRIGGRFEGHEME